MLFPTLSCDCGCRVDGPFDFYGQANVTDFDAAVDLVRSHQVFRIASRFYAATQGQQDYLENQLSHAPYAGVWGVEVAPASAINDGTAFASVSAAAQPLGTRETAYYFRVQDIEFPNLVPPSPAQWDVDPLWTEYDAQNDALQSLVDTSPAPTGYAGLRVFKSLGVLTAGTSYEVSIVVRRADFRYLWARVRGHTNPATFTSSTSVDLDAVIDDDDPFTAQANGWLDRWREVQPDGDLIVHFAFTPTVTGSVTLTFQFTNTKNNPFNTFGWSTGAKAIIRQSINVTAGATDSREIVAVDSASASLLWKVQQGDYGPWPFGTGSVAHRVPARPRVRPFGANEVWSLGIGYPQVDDAGLWHTWPIGVGSGSGYAQLFYPRDTGIAEQFYAGYSGNQQIYSTGTAGRSMPIVKVLPHEAPQKAFAVVTEGGQLTGSLPPYTHSAWVTFGDIVRRTRPRVSDGVEVPTLEGAAIDASDGQPWFVATNLTGANTLGDGIAVVIDEADAVGGLAAAIVRVNRMTYSYFNSTFGWWLSATAWDEYLLASVGSAPAQVVAHKSLWVKDNIGSSTSGGFTLASNYPEPNWYGGLRAYRTAEGPRFAVVEAQYKRPGWPLMQFGTIANSDGLDYPRTAPQYRLRVFGAAGSAVAELHHFESAAMGQQSWVLEGNAVTGSSNYLYANFPMRDADIDPSSVPTGAVAFSHDGLHRWTTGMYGTAVQPPGKLEPRPLSLSFACVKDCDLVPYAPSLGFFPDAVP